MSNAATHDSIVKDDNGQIADDIYNSNQYKYIIVLSREIVGGDWQLAVLTNKKLYIVPGPEKGQWTVRAIPRYPFYQRIIAPKAWRGLSGPELVAASGWGNLLQCNKNGHYIVLTGSLDNALEVANAMIAA